MHTALKIIALLVGIILAGLVVFSRSLMHESEESLVADDVYIKQQVPALAKAQWFSATVADRERFVILGELQKIGDVQVVSQGVIGQDFFRGYRVLAKFDEWVCLNVQLTYPEKQPKLNKLAVADVDGGECLH